MFRYAARRILRTLPVILGMTMIVFLMIHLVPGGSRPEPFGAPGARGGVACLQRRVRARPSIVAAGRRLPGWSGPRRPWYLSELPGAGDGPNRRPAGADAAAVAGRRGAGSAADRATGAGSRRAGGSAAGSCGPDGAADRPWHAGLLDRDPAADPRGASGPVAASGGLGHRTVRDCRGASVTCGDGGRGHPAVLPSAACAPRCWRSCRPTSSPPRGRRV